MQLKPANRLCKGRGRKAPQSKTRNLISGVYRRHPCVAQSTAIAFLNAIDSPLSKQLASYLYNGDHASFIKVGIDPLAYDDVEDFRRDYLSVEFMSKFPNWDLGIDRAAVALEAFHDAERRCSYSNKFLSAAFGMASTAISTASYMYTAQRKIARLLGPFLWDEAEQDFGFGPGATYALPRKLGDTYHKLGCIPEVTRECADLAHLALTRCPAWFTHVAGLSREELCNNLRIVPGNRITTVPKNAKTDRTIAIEPLMNMYIQKGIGAAIRRRLRRVGVDLNDQTINQKLAREGSLTDGLATIDLSAASDTVCLELCRQLLPPDWFRAVELARSPRGILPDGTLIEYQKVSSMGNGFTFELEALIFWALSSTVVDFHAGSETRIAIYGDDIIVPSDCYEPLERLLNHCGFKLNGKKSYAKGPFRESCGKHYFLGRDVSPFYVRESVEDFMSTVLLANNIRRWASRDVHWGLSGWCRPIYESVVALLPPFWQKPRICDGFGDGALIGDFDEVRPQRSRHGFEGYRGIQVSEESETWVAEDQPYFLKALFQNSRKPVPWPHCVLSQGLRPREAILRLKEAVDGESLSSMLPVKEVARKRKYRIVKFDIPQWENAGPWWG